MNAEPGLLWRFCFSFILKALMMGTIVGCAKKTSDTSTSPSTIPVEVPGGTEAPPTYYFYVHSTPISGMYRYIHKQGDFNSKCFVDFAEPTPSKRDINCIVETSELDLSYNGLTMTYNVPGFPKCTYLRQRSSYFLVAAVRETDGSDYTPTKITYTTSAEGLINAATYTVVTKSGNTFNDGTTPKGIAIAPIREGAGKCRYDYSNITNGANCCEGTYNLEVTDSTGVKSITEETWGGHPQSCLDGPARIADVSNEDDSISSVMWRMVDQVSLMNVDGSSRENEKKSARFIPMTPSEVRIFNKHQKMLAKGLSIPKKELLSQKYGTKMDSHGFQLKVMADTASTPVNFGDWKVAPPPAPSKPLYWGSFFLANWLDANQSSPLANIPRPFKDVQDATVGANFGIDSRPNSWTCFDEAEEKYAAINIYVREWNLLTNLKAATSEPIAGSGADDTSGNEDDFPAELKNDFWDWEDLVANGWSFTGFRNR